MLSPSEFVQLWGNINLVKFPSGLVVAIDIPENAKTFLSEAGLPYIADALPDITCAILPFETDSDFVPGSKYSLLTPSPFEASDCLMLARLALYNQDLTDPASWTSDLARYLALEIGTGRVRLIGHPVRNIYEPEFVDEVPDYLFNSSIFQMAEFFVASRKFEAHYRFRWHNAPHQVKPLIDALERKFRRIDPLVIDNPDDWWPKNIQRLRKSHDHRMKIFHDQLVSEN